MVLKDPLVYSEMVMIYFIKCLGHIQGTLQVNNRECSRVVFYYWDDSIIQYYYIQSFAWNQIKGLMAIVFAISTDMYNAHLKRPDTGICDGLTWCLCIISHKCPNNDL